MTTLLSTSAETPTPTDTATPELTPTATATETASLGGWAGLAAPLMGPEFAPPVAPLAQAVTTTHRVISYTYPSTLLRTGDALYRLITATYSSGEFYHYTYDAVGNRQSLTTHEDVVNYQYDNANRLVMAGGVPVGWDNNGNMTSFGSQTYTYDRANRLTQVVSGTLTTGFTYNGAGDRVAKTVDGVTTEYVLDPAAGLTQVLQETTDGQATAYLYGHDLLAQYDSGTWAYHVNDGLGSVRQLADPSGQVVASYSFSPFGVPLGESGGEPYGYTREQWDASAGLVYLRARYYEPGTGRFTQRDPSRLEANPYLYATGNPINRVDPSGLLSNKTIAASFGMESFNNVLALFAQYGDWGLLRLLQDAEVGDKIYAGKFAWTFYQGTIKCYNVGDPLASPAMELLGYPYRILKEGAVILSGGEGLFAENHTLSKLTGDLPTSPRVVTNWYFRNNKDVEPAYTTWTNFGVLPDYVMVSGGGSIPLAFLGPIEIGLGGNINVAVDRYGKVYGGLAGDISAGIPGLPSGSIALGWLNQNGLTGDRWIPKPDELQRFIGGLGGGIAGYAVIGGGLAYNYELPEVFSKTLGGEVGIAIPTVGWTFIEGMLRITQVPGLEWDWVDKYPIEHGYGPMDIRMVDDRPVDCGC